MRIGRLWIAVGLASSVVLAGCGAPYRAPVYTQQPVVRAQPLPPLGQITRPDPNARLREKSLALVDLFASNMGEFLKTNKQAAAIERGKQSVADLLKDPLSAQFRKVRLVKYNNGSVVCGEINGKNSYGGYVGFKPFVAGLGSAFIASVDGKYPDVDRALNAGLSAACG